MAEIIGQGIQVPEKVLTNQDLEKLVDTSDEWIVTRSGIRERRIAADNEFTSHMAVEAAKGAIQEAGLQKEDINQIILATLTPDHILPSCACEIQSALGISGIPAFDISAACSGFIYGLEIASTMIDSCVYKNTLLIAAEKLSTVIDWTDRSTCVLFGDGAGAAVLSANESGGHRILSVHTGADGSNYETLYIPGGAIAEPITAETLDNHRHYVHMNGRELFKIAVRAMVEASETALDKAGIGKKDVTWVVPHQANIRILKSTANRLGVPESRLVTNLDKYGNTSAASIPVALYEGRERFSKGDIVLCPAFGGGLTWGAAVIEW